MHGIEERDWKTFRRLAPIALDRHCAQTLKMAQAIIDAGDQTNYEKYLQLFELIRKRDKEVAYAFDDQRRSTAAMLLRMIYALGLLTDEELNEFTPDMQARITS